LKEIEGKKKKKYSEPQKIEVFHISLTTGQFYYKKYLKLKKKKKKIFRTTKNRRLPYQPHHWPILLPKIFQIQKIQICLWWLYI